MKIALVSCSKNKKDYNCKADEMYSESVLFKKVTKYIKNQKYDKWYILSAKYGLVDPETEIETYNVTLNNMKAQEIKEWSLSVAKRFIDMDIDVVDFYAGQRYRKYLIPLLEQLGIKCNIPLKGLGIGKQLQFLNKGE